MLDWQNPVKSSLFTQGTNKNHFLKRRCFLAGFWWDMGPRVISLPSAQPSSRTPGISLRPVPLLSATPRPASGSAIAFGLAWALGAQRNLWHSDATLIITISMYIYNLFFPGLDMLPRNWGLVPNPAALQEAVKWTSSFFGLLFNQACSMESKL